MDAFGIFYELPTMVYGGRVWGVRPIASHLRIVPDFCYWRGLFVMAGDQADNASGQPQSGFWFGNVDDLWSFGKPAGWGGLWRRSEVKGQETSDPFLMTGFDKKTLHLISEDDRSLRIVVEVDILGDGRWQEYQTISVAPRGYIHHEFPDGYTAHWVRLRALTAGCATAEMFYQ
ncbi:MAG: hypothetical protein EHM72_20675 [Calditrichaeota bacterium]|nr:MAG: hypothetical protein EHM72_20675 [Calditrichota bacterium]